MESLKNIREFFWPLLEKCEPQNPKLLTKEDITNEDLKETLEYSIKFYETESERKASIEQKTTIFIGTISVVTSIIIGATVILANSKELNIATFILFLVLFILIIYMARTLWFSIKVLQRKSFFTISINDFILAETKDDYYKTLIVEISNKTKKNYKVINEKVDNMTMAQEYFKRAIIVIIIYAFFILVYFILKFIC